jgi:hypothetical protein
LVEVLWSLAERILSDERKRVEAEDSVGNRVARLISSFVRICRSNPGLRQGVIGGSPLESVETSS